MSATYFAEVHNGVVLRVIVADAAFVAQMEGLWVETTMDGSKGKNYAGIGYKFDEARAAFISPDPKSPDFVFNAETLRFDMTTEAKARLDEKMTGGGK